MAANPVQTAIAAVPDQTRPSGIEAPYIGLRPFDRSERAIFFGRDQDAQFLSDKIFSARLTLLYAKSGVGKSSILRTLVVPIIEEQHARVVYFDACGGAEPYELLRATLIKLASEIGIPDAGVGAPTLSELVRLLRSADDKTMVLILDQFEEFLIAHGQRLDPLRKELAALVRSDLDVRIVLSLRQEFLAALEPFRYEMLNLFQSTYLLDSLDDKGIRGAIEKPALLFGKRYEPGLLDQLIADLREQEVAGAASPASIPIDLPMMQLVCSELWKAASKQTTLGLDLYREMGGAEKILDNYVRGVMPQRWSEQRLTARLMKHLAPSSGFKRSYSVVDLARNEGLDSDQVHAELQRLSKHRIIQSREFRGQELWELQHDAFIRMIAPWRDNVLRRAAKQRRMMVGVVAFFVIAAITVGFVWPRIKERREIYANTEAPLSELKAMSAEDRARLAEMRIDMATAYMLEKGRIDLLSSLLKKYAEEIPPDYGLNSSEYDDTQVLAEETACESLCVHYSSARSLDRRYFDQTWSFWVKEFAEKRGIPVPPRLRLIAEPSYPKSLIRFTDGAHTLVEFRTPPHDYGTEIFITSENLQVPNFRTLSGLKNFLHVCGDDCRKIDTPQNPRLELWAVPRWSRPIWKVAGRTATDSSGLPALLLGLELQRDPEHLFTDDAFTLLLERARQDYPQTLSEALAARGGRLKQDMVELVKLGRPLSDLAAILDALAAYPELDCKQAADRVHHDLLEIRLPTLALRKPDNSRISSSSPSSLTVNGYEGASDYLPAVGRPIQVYLGGDLEPLWTSKEKNELNPEILESVNGLRDELFKQFGVQLPSIYFNHSNADPSLPAMAFRIEMVNAPEDPSSREVFKVDASNAMAVLVDALKSRATRARIQFLLAEDIFEQRKGVGPEFRKWLERNYSLTEQKLIMRGVIDPSTAQKENPSAILVEETLRHQDWLLASLVFWSQVPKDGNDLKLAESLRATQRARLKPARFEMPEGSLLQNLNNGIRALEGGHIPQAERLFSRAIAMNRRAAIQGFLSLYPESLNRVELREFSTLCKDPEQSSRYKWTDDLEEFLAHVGKGVNPEEERSLGLCLLQAYNSGLHKKQVAIEADLLHRFSQPENWPAPLGQWFAVKILNSFDPFADPPSLREGAEQLLKSASLRLSPEQRHEAFSDVAAPLDQPGPKRWRWKLLQDLAGLQQDNALEVELAWRLSSSDSREDLQQALDLASRAEQNLKRQPPTTQSAFLLNWCSYIKAITFKQLSGLGLEDHWKEAEKILQGLPDAQFGTTSELLDLRLTQGRYTEVITATQNMIEQNPEDSGLYRSKLLAELLSGDKASARNTAAAALQKADELEHRNRDRQLCRRYVSDLLRAIVAKDKATESADFEKIKRVEPNLDKDFDHQMASYLGSLESGNQKDSDAALQQLNNLEQRTRVTLQSMLFTAALGEMMTDSESVTAEETARRFIETDHEYVPYIAMMLYARTSGPAQQEAREVIQQRWKNFDHSHWKERLRGGDETVWREMLIGYYLGELQRKDIFGQLEDEQEYARSDLRALPVIRQGLLCEAYFYDALLASVKGKDNDALHNSDLQKVLDTRVSSYIEYVLAKFLLAEANSRH